MRQDGGPDPHRSRSSGFVWRPGLIVTADEALSEDGEFAVTLSDGHTVPAQLVGRDPSTDLALLRVDRSDLRPVPLEAAAVSVGAVAIAIGAEDGTPTAALGVVSRSEGPWRSSMIRSSTASSGPRKACLPGAQEVVLQNVNHNGPVRDPAAFTAAVLEFLSQR